MIKIQKFRFNGYRESTYVIWEEESKETFILDPGCGDDTEQAMLADFISEQKLIPVKILNMSFSVIKFGWVRQSLRCGICQDMLQDTSPS